VGGRTTLDELTKREREVVELVAEGHSNRAIAQALFVPRALAHADKRDGIGNAELSDRVRAAARVATA